MATRYWIGVVSREHVHRGVAGGFAQVGHGKGGPLRRMSAGDWLMYYSPKESLESTVPVQAFTAAGKVSDGNVYQVTVSPEFQPWRIDVEYAAGTSDAPIQPLLDKLSFTAGQRNWGYRFRTGHFEILPEDFHLIATAIGLSVET